MSNQADNVPPPHFWIAWLAAVTTGVALCGLILIVMPRLAVRGFSALIYADASRIEAFGQAPVAYVALLHAVLGAVLFGWGVALLLVLRGWLVRGMREAWWVMTVSVAGWFIADTGFSWIEGFQSNVILNVAIAVLYAIPVTATSPALGAHRLPR